MANAERRQQQEDIRNMLRNFLRSREQLIDFIYKGATKLDGHHKNVITAKVVTGSSGIAGTVISLVFALPTGGLSLLVPMGIGLATVSGIAYLGSDITEYFLNRSYISDLTELCRVDEEDYFALDNYFRRRLEQLPVNVSIQITSLASLSCSIVRVERVVSRGARSIRVFRTASVVLGAATLPLQIIDLHKDGRALHQNERSEMAQKFRQLAEDLTVQTNNVRRHIERTINHTFNPVTIILLPFIALILLLIMKIIFQIGSMIFL